MSEHAWIAAVLTDCGQEVWSVHLSRESARLACPEHGRPLPIDRAACRALASEHGIVVDENGEGPDGIEANDVLPDVWSDRDGR